MTLSLHSRLLVAASLVLTAFLGLTGLTLDRALRASAEAGVHDRLQGYVYALLAAADLGPNGVLHLPDSLPEARFSTPASGLYAEVGANRGNMRWRSPSALGLDASFPADLPAGAWRFQQVRTRDGTPLFALSFGVSWEGSSNAARSYTFTVAEDLGGFNAQVSRFRRSLWGWLAAAAAVLLAVQGTILRWSLSPLRRVALDLTAMESGLRNRLEGDYPRELRGLTENLNSLIHSERAQRARYRDALADLAHSLKTPLAVLRGSLGASATAEELRNTMQEQLGRMNQIVDYQLQRASASGHSTLVAPVSVAQAAERVAATLSKVYRDKGVICSLKVEDGACFYGDEGDLLELLGNLADNAFKWSRGRVEIRATALREPPAARAGLRLAIDDDGPGIPEDQAERVLERGARAGAGTEGQGIGLAVVRDIVQAYRGTLTIRRGPLGGAQVEVRLPAA
ncbi:MAG: hypothetical protein B7Z66_03185 [Chromatiales bacterium 21-64-14]|nr:MAG: hypothetical protein B7Z66_03185 [Chromatiales bacterium 21-64-14]HQU15858.1 ATP-binding protein [Gammaproteobacteria bacterium]